jgi:dienelactone hydrolase
MVGLEEVTIPGGDGAPESPSVAMIPDGARRGVVVIHEIFGRQPEIDRVVERFANAGYAAVASDLFRRGKFACMRDVFRCVSLSASCVSTTFAEGDAGVGSHPQDARGAQPPQNRRLRHRRRSRRLAEVVSRVVIPSGITDSGH